MIQSISVRNIALIEQMTIDFHSGLQVLTGETGAGKSIVVDAVKLLLGGRADRGLIRSGCDKSVVEAVFDIPESNDVASLMNRESIDFDGKTVTVYREISSSGRNICRICGVITSLGFLKELSPFLMNLHGQSEHQFLADPDTHLTFLDRLGDSDHAQLLENVRECCRRFIINHREYARLVRMNQNRDIRIEQLERELKELQEGFFTDGEEQALQNDLRRMKTNEKYSATIAQTYQILAGNENSPIEALKNAGALMRSVISAFPEMEEIHSRCDHAYYEIEDIAYQLSQLMEKSEYDPALHKRIEKRLDQIRHIQIKYGDSAEEIKTRQTSDMDELRELQQLSERIETTGSEHKKLLSEYRAAARKLTESRKRLAEQFSRQMMRELSGLGMENTLFEVRFSDISGGKPIMPTEKGDDHAEFLICPNPGEPMMPLAEIASGGELSRLMLAMKVLEADHAGTDCMVFDEIDTGISGKMAQTVAEKMIQISRHHQVICVSHLPQLAAAGDYQYQVSKSVQGSRTLTNVAELDRGGRIGEIARMISGADGISENSIAYAEQMLNAAETVKSKKH